MDMVLMDDNENGYGTYGGCASENGYGHEFLHPFIIYNYYSNTIFLSA